MFELDDDEYDNNKLLQGISVAVGLIIFLYQPYGTTKVP